MASSIWTLKKNSGSYSALSALGIVGAKVTKASLDMGSLTFVVPVADIAATAPYAYGDTLILKRNTVIWFVGRVRVVAASFSAGQAAWSVACYDAWWEMERTVYRQPITVSKDDFSGLLGYMTSRVTLNRDAWGVGITQDGQFANALTYGAAENPSIISLTAAPTLPTWPVEETREITVAEAMRRAAGLAASVFGFFDYSSGSAGLTLAARASLGLVTLDLASANLITEVAGLHRRDDIVPPGVIFDFFTTVTDSTGKQLTKITRQTGGSPGGAGTISASFNLGPCDAIPTGAASAYYSALSTAQWEGTLTLMEQDCSGSVAPGNRLRLSNGQTAWATMDAVVQRTTEDLDHGITSIEVGPSAVLGMDDFIGQLTRLRNRPAPTTFCDVQHNGTAGVTSGVDDNGSATTTVPSGSGQGVSGPVTSTKPGVGSPAGNSNAGNALPTTFPTVDISVCIDGSAATIRAVGVRLG